MSDDCRFPQLCKLLAMIADDNGGCLASEIEAKLRDVPDDVLGCLAAGEHGEMREAMRRLESEFQLTTYETQVLDRLLNLAFEGF